MTSQSPLPTESINEMICYPALVKMRQEHVTLHNVDVKRLYNEIKKYLEGLKLDIIHEEVIDKPSTIAEFEGFTYWDIKAHKGAKGSIIIGNVRDVEVMISGSEKSYDVILRTGAWGKDIVVPAAIAGVLTLGVAAIPAGAVSGYRAHKFEKDFWKHIQKTLSEIGKANATMSEPVTVTH